MHMLNQLNADFYRRNAASFSATRQRGWPGWSSMLEGPAGSLFCGRPPGETGVSILDVACGNMRFARFLQERFPNVPLRYCAVDNCAPLAGDAPVPAAFHELDIVGELLAGTLDRSLPQGEFDLVTCFGFLHHVPGWDNRVQLLRLLASKVKPGGYAAISFWQFLNSPDLAARAHSTHAQALQELGIPPARLEPGDYLLSWQDTGTYRYCHNFTPPEVAQLVDEAALTPQIATTYNSDGRTQNLNHYLVLQA